MTPSRRSRLQTGDGDDRSVSMCRPSASVNTVDVRRCSPMMTMFQVTVKVTMKAV